MSLNLLLLHCIRIQRRLDKVHVYFVTCRGNDTKIYILHCDTTTERDIVISFRKIGPGKERMKHTLAASGALVINPLQLRGRAWRVARTAL